jgi:hypothetical protein
VCEACGTLAEPTAEHVSPDTLPPDPGGTGPLEPGSLFADRSLVVVRIGGGGMGVVFTAIDRVVDEAVAL